MGWTSRPPPGTLLLACGSLHLLARKAYERTLVAESDRAPRQHDALSAIILSVVSLEALIGELVEVVRGFLTTKKEPDEDFRKRGMALIDALELIEEERGQLRLKFQISKLILSGTPYNTGAKLYQDFDLLLDIRNGLVHPKALAVKANESGAVVDPFRKFREKLRSLEITAEIQGDDVVAPLSTWVQTRAAARWACNTATGMVHSLFEAAAANSLAMMLKAILASGFNNL